MVICIRLTLCFSVRTIILFCVFHRNPSFFAVFLKRALPPLKLILSHSFGSSLETVANILLLHPKFLNYAFKDTYKNHKCFSHTLTCMSSWAYWMNFFTLHALYSPRILRIFGNFNFLFHPLLYFQGLFSGRPSSVLLKLYTFRTVSLVCPLFVLESNFECIIVIIDVT